jgi:hypothetical protein
MIILLVLGALVVSAPVAAAVLVTYASRREESAYSLCSRPRNKLQAAARRLLGFQPYDGPTRTRHRVPRPRNPEDDRDQDRPLAARRP